MNQLWPIRSQADLGRGWQDRRAARVFTAALIMVFSAMCMSPAGAAAGTNLLSNASFEQAVSPKRPQGWAYHIGTAGAEAEYIRSAGGVATHDGTHAIAIRGGDHVNDRWVMMDEALPTVTGGEPYELSVRLKAEETDKVRFSLVWLDGEGETVSVDHTQRIRGTGDWSRESLIAIAPHGAKKSGRSSP